MDATHLPGKELAGLPMCRAVLTRRAIARVREAQIDLKPLLLRAGMTVAEADDPDTRIAVRKQVAFLNLAADALGDDCLDLTLATEFDCRDLGLWYYVLAWSDTLHAGAGVLAQAVDQLRCGQAPAGWHAGRRRAG